MAAVKRFRAAASPLDCGSLSARRLAARFRESHFDIAGGGLHADEMPPLAAPDMRG